MKIINNSHGREGVYITQHRLSIFINFNFDFLALYKMYFRNYFANRCKKLESFTSTIYNIRVCVVSDVMYSFYFDYAR